MKRVPDTLFCWAFFADASFLVSGARERLEQEIARYKKFAQVFILGSVDGLEQNSHEAVSISRVDDGVLRNTD